MIILASVVDLPRDSVHTDNRRPVHLEPTPYALAQVSPDRSSGSESLLLSSAQAR